MVTETPPKLDVKIMVRAIKDEVLASVKPLLQSLLDDLRSEVAHHRKKDSKEFEKIREEMAGLRENVERNRDELEEMLERLVEEEVESRLQKRFGEIVSVIEAMPVPRVSVRLPVSSTKVKKIVYEKGKPVQIIEESQ